jgi:hypothetical protein
MRFLMSVHFTTKKDAAGRLTSMMGPGNNANGATRRHTGQEPYGKTRLCRLGWGWAASRRAALGLDDARAATART